MDGVALEWIEWHWGGWSGTGVDGVALEWLSGSDLVKYDIQVEQTNPILG